MKSLDCGEHCMLWVAKTVPTIPTGFMDLHQRRVMCKEGPFFRQPKNASAIHYKEITLKKDNNACTKSRVVAFFSSMPCIALRSPFANSYSKKRMFDMTGIIIRYLIFVPILLFYGEQV